MRSKIMMSTDNVEKTHIFKKKEKREIKKKKEHNKI